MNYYNILIPIKTNKYFTYKSELELKRGHIVKVPFRNKYYLGLVISKTTCPKNMNVKDIVNIHFNMPIPAEYFDFMNWFVDYYFTYKGIVFRNMISSLTKNRKRYIVNERFYKKYNLEYSNIPLSKTAIKRIFKINDIRFQELINRELFEEISPFIKARPIDIKLNKEQSAAFEKIKHSIDNASYKGFLLMGKPSSGKSEVYIKAMHYVFNNTSKSILLLLPEIGLVDYMKKRIELEFGSINIAVLHSELSDGEKYFYINEILNKKRRIIIGTRSAIFSPMHNLGLVVIDEEQDMSFRQTDASPYYNGRDIGIYLAYKHNAIAILCSATPSIETYYNALNGKYELLELKHEYIKKEKPIIKLFNSKIDKKIFPIYIIDNINENLRNNRQTIIFLNRRGYLNLYKCTKCNEYFKCKNCSVSYSYHKDINMFVCHYCGHKESVNAVCPNCGGQLKSMGIIGTQKVENIIKQLFPDANIKRMDLDSVSNKGTRESIINNMLKGKTDILIGTQMVSKGYDIPNVDTIIMLNTDMMINIPDIKRQEHFIQLLIQTAGRAGRRNKRGNVFIDMDNPGKFAKIIYNLDYKTFMKMELKDRKELSFPPYKKMMRIFIRERDKSRAIERINIIYKILMKIKDDTLLIFPPMPSIIDKIQGKYTYNIYIMYSSFSRIKPYLLKLKNRFDFIHIDNT